MDIETPRSKADEESDSVKDFLSVLFDNPVSPEARGNALTGIQSFNEKRNRLNREMAGSDDFFQQFGNLDDTVYAGGAIPKKYKELTGLSISVLSRCEECILYHLQGCIAENNTRKEMIEAIKIGVIGGGSLTYPSARFAFEALAKLGINE